MSDKEFNTLLQFKSILGFTTFTDGYGYNSTLAGFQALRAELGYIYDITVTPGLLEAIASSATTSIEVLFGINNSYKDFVTYSHGEPILAESFEYRWIDCASHEEALSVMQWLENNPPDNLNGIPITGVEVNSSQILFTLQDNSWVRVSVENSTQLLITGITISGIEPPETKDTILSTNRLNNIYLLNDIESLINLFIWG